ncbi:MAG: hypothetical protein CSA36_07645 [Draconibacterium sp.]|nr:MAG: hypothetical protein CSA36_07645 [Draconibacterium sp.]
MVIINHHATGFLAKTGANLAPVPIFYCLLLSKLMTKRQHTIFTLYTSTVKLTGILLLLSPTLYEEIPIIKFG